MSLLIPDVLERRDPAGEPAPVVLDSPHSGHLYPADFDHAPPRETVRRSEDAFVDELFADAPGHGATLVRALFPRSYIDPNRAETDLDVDLLDGPWPDPVAPGEKTGLGVGLVPRREPGGPMYRRLLTVAEVRARIDGYYRPYHRALAEALDGTRARAGRVYHIDCHSMPAVSTDVSPEGPGMARPDFCLGDRDGETCEPGFTEHVRAWLSDRGHRVAVNDPYKGVEIVRRYADPADGRHCLQVEINRGLYMDEARIERSGGFAALRETLSGLVASVCAYARGRGAP